MLCFSFNKKFKQKNYLFLLYVLKTKIMFLKMPAYLVVLSHLGCLKFKPTEKICIILNLIFKFLMCGSKLIMFQSREADQVTECHFALEEFWEMKVRNTKNCTS